MSGLYAKYQVWKDGQSVADVFVLRPKNDPAAKEAVLRYAEVTPDQELASDLRKWAAALTPGTTDVGLGGERMDYGPQGDTDASM